MEAARRPATIYFSYASEDEQFARELQSHFVFLRRQGQVEILNQRIVAGSNMSIERDLNLRRSDIIILLISASFLASDYCYSVELQRALERHKAGEARVVPVLIRSCQWQNTPLAELQMLPVGGLAVNLWPSRDKVYVDIAQAINSLVNDLQSYHLQVPSIKETTPERVIKTLDQEALSALVCGNLIPLRETLETYRQHNPGEQLVLRDGDEFVYYDDLPAVMLIWQIWQALTKAIASQNTAVLRPLFQELAALLCLALNTQPAASLQQSAVPAFFVTVLETGQAFGNLKIPDRVPLVFYAGRFLGTEDTDVLHQLLQQMGLESRLAVLVLFIEPKTLVRSQQLLKEFQRTYACDIIPLLCGDFLKITEAREPVKALRQWVLSQVDLSDISPFETSGPTPQRMFFGREQELRTIREHARTASYALVGGRRIGKTSILLQLQREDLPRLGIRVIWVDASKIHEPADLMEMLRLNPECFPVPPATPFPSLDSLFRALPQDKPLVMLLDEADKMVPGEQQAGYPLLNELRALANAGRCRFVFAGEYALLHNLEDPYSPLFNFANKMPVGPLNERAASQLVREPLSALEIELQDEEAIIRRIVTFTAGHPNVIQRLCSRLVGNMNQEQRRLLAIEDVEQVITNSDFLREDFLNTYWGQATHLERICTLAMAKDQHLHTLVEIHTVLLKHLPAVTLSDVNDALTSLANLRNLIRSTSSGYVFAVEGFPMALARTHVLDDVFALACARYQQGLAPWSAGSSENKERTSASVKRAKRTRRPLFSGIFPGKKKNT